MTTGQLQRRLGLTSAVSITVGAVIGSGIFLKPLPVARSMPSEGWIYLLWVGLGLVCLFGAFAYAELGSMFPEAGGQYAFLREGWGRFVSFLYGWTFFWVINAGTVAALALAVAKFLLPVLGVDPAVHPAAKLIAAAAMILFLAVVNHFGVAVGALLQNLSTFAKVGALGLLVVGGIVRGVAVANGVHTEGHWVPAAGVQTSLGTPGMVAAFIAIFWAYEGWYQLPFNAAELKRPARDLPLGLIVGMVILIAVYTAVNAMYLHEVPFDEMRSFAKEDTQRVPYLTVSRIFSENVGSYLTLLVAISVFGSANPNLLSSPRAFYAMGQDGLVPAALTRVSPRWGTPTVAIWTQAIWALLIVLVPWFTPADWGLRDFDDVTSFVVFAGFLFYGLTVASVYRLRLARPDLPRTYRCTGYPWTPALFILLSVAFVVALLKDPDEIKNAEVGLGIIAAGIVYYLLFLRGRAQPATTG
jgi:APA family basic amino acid/polyamine antiporter